MYSIHDRRRMTDAEEFLYLTLPLIDPFRKKFPELYAKTEQEIADKKGKKKGTPYAWIGINPPLGKYNMTELYNTALAQLPYGHYELCVEQNTKGGIRPHIHLLVPIGVTARKNHVITRLAKIFDVTEQSINVTISSNKVLKDKWVNYIHGDKAAEKLENVEQDKKDRLALNLPDFFIK
ncbi:MAG: putative replication initiation protein [Cressdnaviricota sp.]|nr:MAG: putative replication initiation protein [Cressdnaviricota sp.]